MTRIKLINADQISENPPDPRHPPAILRTDQFFVMNSSKFIIAPATTTNAAVFAF